MSNCQDKPTFLPEALWKALMNLPALRYMKAPVNNEAELYEKYPIGNEKGTFAFVHNDNTFYTYHPRGWNRGKWKPISADGVSSFFEIDAEFLKEGDILVYDSNKKKFVVRSGNVWNKLIGDIKDTFVQVTKFLNQVDEIPTDESDSGVYFVHKNETVEGVEVEFRALYIVLGKKAIKIYRSSDYYTATETQAKLDEKASQVQVDDIAASVDVLAVTKADKSIVDSILAGVIRQPSVDTYNSGANSLAAIYGLTPTNNGTNGKPKENGWDVEVREDETKGGKSNRYNWNGEEWIDMNTGNYPDDVVIKEDVLNRFGRDTEKPIAQDVVSRSFENTNNEIFATAKSQLTADLVTGAILKGGTAIGSNIAPDYKRTSVANPNMFNVQKGERHIYTGVIDDINYCGVAYFTEDFQFISYECGYVNSFVNFELTIPENAFYIGSCSMNSDPVINILTQTGKVSYLQEKQKELADEIFATDNLTAGVTTGAIRKVSGAADSNADYRRTSTANPNMFNVQKGKRHYYTGVIDDINYCGVAYFTEDFQFISYECGYVNSFVNFELTIPENAFYIGSCSMNSDPVISFASSKIPNYEVCININSQSDDEDGSKNNPYKSINSAIRNNIRGGAFLIYEGDYRETLQLSLLSSGTFEFKAMEGQKVRVLGSNKLENWTKTGGYTNVYEIPFSGSVPNMARMGGALIFEDGNPSKLIEDRHFHPLQKNLRYRLPFTPIYPKNTIDEVNNNAGTYCIVDGKMYLHTSNSDNPNTNDFSYENITRASNTYIKAQNQTNITNLILRNIQFMFSADGFVANGFSRTIRYNCVSLCSTGAGAWNNASGYVETWFEEAGFCNNDGNNSHFAGAFSDYPSLSDNRSAYPTVVHNYMWSHDNGDDGESSHENHNIVLEGCLLEFNGDSGSRPSNDATYYARDCVFRNNGWEVTQNGNLKDPSRGGEGFSVVNPAISPYRVGCRAILFNCVSEENNVGFATISQDANRIEIINCISRNNTAELYAVKGKMIVRNCKATNADPDKIKITASGGTIEVYNDELVEA